MADKLNQVDFHWYLVRTQPGHERELASLIEREKEKTKNILEAYCPTHTIVNVRQGGREGKMPLFDGYVFVHATLSALVDFLNDRCPNTSLRYNRKITPEDKATPCTIPEAQMRAFMDFNENYADKVVVLERPFTDYAYNHNDNDEPNEIVRVVDGPLAGCEGFVCRFRRKRGIVFQINGMTPGTHLTVSYPNVYDLHVVRLHNAENDRLSIGTEKARAADLIIGMLQGCGYGKRTLPMLYGIIERLAAKASLVELCKEFHKQGEETLGIMLSRMTEKEAELVLNLARYERDFPGYVRQAYSKLILRPFLTPTSGYDDFDEKGETRHEQENFTEIIRKVNIAERVYYPSKQASAEVTTSYYAHIGVMRQYGSHVLFANWNDFLGEYFLTGDHANEKLVSGGLQRNKLIDSFRNYAPTLYKVLTDEESKVNAIPDFKVGDEKLNVMAVTSSDIGQGTDELINTCVNICKEINTTNHLAVWRRYLRTVWLHQ